MPKRRYYYDRKGNLTGSSSDTYLATPKGIAGFIMVLFAMAIWRLVFGSPEESRLKEESVDVQKAERIAPANMQPDKERSHERTTKVQPKSQVPIAENREQLMKVPNDGQTEKYNKSKGTEAYMRRTYVDGNPECHRDLVTYQLKECRTGDQQTCRLLERVCGASIEREVASGAISGNAE